MAVAIRGKELGKYRSNGGEPNPSRRKELRHSRFGDLKALLELR